MPLRAGAALLLGASVLLLSAPAGAQRDAVIGPGAISHIGVAVADVDASARAYAEVFGLPQPTVNEKLALASPAGGPAAIVRVATLALPNFLIELQQYKTEYGPIHELVTAYGPTVHHISFTVDGPFAETRQRLIQRGGRWTGGTPATAWSYVDFREALGATFEPISRAIHERLGQQMTAAPRSGTFGAHPVVGIGFVVRSVAEAARAYAEVLGIATPAVRTTQPRDYPRGTRYDRRVSVKTAHWTHENGVAIQLDEPGPGRTLWSEALERGRGNTVHRLIIEAGSDLSATVRRLQAKGGALVYGRSDGPVAYLDFTTTLGLVLEVIRSPTARHP